nr:hypothetical protein GCM10020093_103680 [Planobispora longispora]
MSEALGSNGSTSMGSVCASTMSLLDAGVPLKGIVAGIAMGLINEGDQYVTLTDILGAEDAMGDMDFKVAGTKDVITALQLDTKLDGIPASVLAAALKQAKGARLAIIDVMQEAIDSPAEMNATAPRIITIKVPVDKIGEVIGPKGKMINQIQDDTGAEITIEDDGTIYIGATDGPSAEAARSAINAIANPHMPEVGERYLGTVVKIAAFGAFISLMPGKDGLLHVSQIRKLHGGKRIENVEDVMNVGEKIQVEIAEIDSRGKLSLVPVEVVEKEAEAKGEAGTPSRASRTRPPPPPPLPPRTGPPRTSPAAPACGPAAAAATAGRRPQLVMTTTLHPGKDGAGVVQRTVLPGGLRVVTESMPTVRSVAVGMWVGIGSRDEAPEHMGASHFLEHLLFKGTPHGTPWRSPRPSRASAVRSTPSPPRSTPATTPGSSTRT